MEIIFVLIAVVYLLIVVVKDSLFSEERDFKDPLVQEDQKDNDSNEREYKEGKKIPAEILLPELGVQYIYDEKFTCPEECNFCYKALRELTPVYNHEILETGYDFLFPDVNFGVAINNALGIATFFSTSDDEEDIMNFPFKKSYPNASHVISRAWTLDSNHFLIGLYPYYAILFKAYPPAIEMATFPLRYIIHPKVSLKACCFSELPSLILEYSGLSEPIVFHLFPIGAIPIVKIISIEDIKEEVLPEIFHPPLIDILLFRKSNEFGTSSFGRVLEILIEEERFSKEDVWNTLLFFYAHPFLPIKDLLKVASTQLSSEELEAVLVEAINQDRNTEDKAFIFRLLSEISYKKGDLDKSFMYAKQALRLDDKVGVKRLLRKLEKQLHLH